MAKKLATLLFLAILASAGIMIVGLASANTSVAIGGGASFVGLMAIARIWWKDWD